MVLDRRLCLVHKDPLRRYTACLITIRDLGIDSIRGVPVGKCGNCGMHVVCWEEPKCSEDWYVCPDCYPKYCVLCESRKPELVGARRGEIVWI